jgi:crotonobetainyl-CoA:carnitine CoA-transferase CaiB-like acyl-CoA transferase
MLEFEAGSADRRHEQVLVDPQITAQRNGRRAVHPTCSRYRRVRPAARFSRTPPDPSAPAALYAEHGDAILAELGYDREERERMRARGVLA